MKNNIKTISRLLITIILSVSIIAYILIHLFASTILNENYVLSKLQEGDYYNQTYELVKSNFENYIDQSGLDEEILNNIVTKEKVKEDTKKIIINIYDGLNEEISTQEIKKKLNENINKSLQDQVLSENEKNAIEQFIEKICEEYKMTISHFEYEKEINNIYQNIMKYIDLAKKISMLTIGGLIIILIILSLKRLYKIGTSIGISGVVSGTILAIISHYIKTNIKVHTITIIGDAVSYILRDILGGILTNLQQYGIILLIFGIGLIILSNLVHNITKYGISENE